MNTTELQEDHPVRLLVRSWVDLPTIEQVDEALGLMRGAQSRVSMGRHLWHKIVDDLLDTRLGLRDLELAKLAAAAAEAASGTPLAAA